MKLIGVGVNAKIPLGSSVEDLRRLPQAWANVVPLPGDLRDRDAPFAGRVRNAAGHHAHDRGPPRTGAVLRSVGKICGLPPSRVRRTSWSELGRTAKLPWYARLASPETFRRRRVAIFGDFTHTLGLGYTLAREVGLEIGVCGTYLSHLERDFLFHANTFTDGAFVSDDPDEVASRIEAAGPDLVVGTHLEREVAESLGVAFLPLCPPTARHPFAERTTFGYAGASVIADHLDEALRRSSERPSGAEGGMPWTGEALEELEEIPAFLRGRARRLAEERAHSLRSPTVTPGILAESRRR